MRDHLHSDDIARLDVRLWGFEQVVVTPAVSQLSVYRGWWQSDHVTDLDLTGVRRI